MAFKYNLLFYIYFLLFLVNQCNARTLKIYVSHENEHNDGMCGEPIIKLKTIFAQQQQAEERIMDDVQQSVTIGQQVDILVPQTVNEIEVVNFVFDIYLTPTQPNWGYEPSGHDENPADDQPFESPLFGWTIDDIRTMVRTVDYVLRAPNLSKLYTINLGKIGCGPSAGAEFWSRRIVLGTNNAIKSDNFHAFLYADVNKNQRTNLLIGSERVFVGHAPLLKMEKRGGDEAAFTSTKKQSFTDNSTAEASTSQQSLNEYYFAIPINVKRLFKHKILSFHLEIYRFYEEKFIDQNSVIDQKQTDDKLNNECPICFLPLTDEKLTTITMHENSNDQSSKHIFHKDCILEWVSTEGKFFCPLCNYKPISIMTMQYLMPLFDSGNGHRMPLLISTNPLSELIQIANGHGQIERVDEFQRSQAKIFIKILAKYVDEKDEILRKHLSIKMGPIGRLFKIGLGDVEQNAKLDEIVPFLEKFRKKRQQNILSIWAIMALQMIEKIRYELTAKSENFFENIQLIREEDMTYDKQHIIN